MTLILAFLAAHLSAVIPSLIAVGAVIMAWLKGKSADSKVATATQAQAQAEVKVAKYEQANAQAAAQAADTAVQTAQEHTNVENDVASLPAGAANQQLQSGWSKD